jgi:hypothetical protein
MGRDEKGGEVSKDIDLPTIDAPDLQFQVEIQDDGFGLRLGVEQAPSNCDWIHVSVLSTCELSPQYIERDMNGNGEFEIYHLAMIDADEFIPKLRLFLHAYDALKRGEK